MTANRQGFVHPGLIILIKSGHYLITDKRMPSLPIVAASSGFSLSMTNSLLPDARYTIDYVGQQRTVPEAHFNGREKGIYLGDNFYLFLSVSWSTDQEMMVQYEQLLSKYWEGIAVTWRSLMCHWLIIDTGKKSIRARNKMFCFRETARVNSWVH